jgi:hypothetical protein
MAYVTPSVLVYQQLENSGGVLNSTPDLHACIIGPCYTEVTYVAGSTDALVLTSAKSSTTTTGTAIVGSKDITVASISGFFAGDSVILEGAAASAGPLAATVVSVVGNVVTIDTAVVTAVTSSPLSKKGLLVNASVPNTYSLPGVKPGMVVVAPETKVYLNNVLVNTMTTQASGHNQGNVLTVTAAATTGAATAAASTVTVASATGFVIGDRITVAGAGASGVNLVSKIVNIVGSVITIATPIVTTVASAAVTKNNPLSVNPLTNTYVAEPGDTLKVAYTNTSAVSSIFTTLVQSVTTSAGGITNLSLTDALPTDLSAKTTASTVVSTAAITVASPTGFSVNGKVRVVGTGFDIYSSIVGIAGSVFTLADSIPATQAGVQVYSLNTATVFVQKGYSDQLLPLNKPLTTGTNYATDDIGTFSQFTINAAPELVYGPIISAEVHVGYRALRTDLAGTVMEIADVNDLEGVLGAPTVTNPLSLGVQLALANTATSVRCISVPSNDLIGYQVALELAENMRLYALVPLTQDIAIINALKTHCDQLSVPEKASWRVALINVKTPDAQSIGQYSVDFQNSAAGITIDNIAGKFVLHAANAAFLSDGMVPGDIINVTAATPSGAINTYVVQQVVSNQQVVVDATQAATGITYWASRTLTKTQKAEWVAETSAQFNDKRVINIQPDTCGVSIGGVTQYLPGYYLACAVAGMTAGFAVQQGFTNIGLAGITDLKRSNFYFTRSQMDRMAETGTFLIVQDVQGGTPYVRHAMTTDISVLEYREFLVVKNWDFLSYYFYDKLKPFIGSWNITTDTLNNIRQTITASAELLKSKKLPKIGPPLVDYKLTSIAQSTVNKDNIDVRLNISVVYPNNYTNLYLII